MCSFLSKIRFIRAFFCINIRLKINVPNVLMQLSPKSQYLWDERFVCLTRTTSLEEKKQCFRVWSVY